MISKVRLLLFICLCRSALARDAACTCLSSSCNCVGVGVDAKKAGLNLTKKDYTFTGNEVTNIAKNLFQPLTNLRSLVLRENGISTVSETTFNANVMLTQLDLSNNFIKTLPPLLFRRNTKLKRFYCHNNSVTAIHRDLFKGLLYLADVRIFDNQLTQVDPAAFQTNKLLFELYLDNNLLETAYWSWISHFNHSSKFELYLDGNPWSCDCRMRQFREGLDQHKWTRRLDEQRRLTVPSCTDLPGRPKIKDVSIDEMTCTSPTVTSQSNCSKPCYVTFDEHSMATLECEGSGEPTPKAQITDVSGAEKGSFNSGSRRAVWKLDSVTLDDAGEYFCIVTGADSDGNVAKDTSSILVIVKPTSSSHAGAIVGIVVALIVVVGAIGFFYRRYKERKGYGALSNEPDSMVHYDVNNHSNIKDSNDVSNLHDDDDVKDNLLQDDYVSGGDKEVLV